MIARRILALLVVGLLALAPAGATVNSQASKTTVLGDGHTTSFAFSFIGVAAQYITVLYTDAAGNQTTLTQGAGATQYQITLNPPVQGAIWGLGGTITYNPSSVPIAAGTTLTIFRTLPLTQAVTLQNLSSIAVLGKGAETGLDTGVMQGQQINEQISRAIVANIANSAAPLPLPPAAQMANKGLCGDATGLNVTACVLPSSGVISSAMQPVVNAATLAVGRAALGLLGAATNNIGYGLQTGVNAPGGNAQFDVNFPAVSVATTQTIVATNHLSRYTATGPITFNLSRGNTLWNGFGFWVNAVSSTVLLVPNANDSIVTSTGALASGASLSIAQGQQVFVYTDGATFANWYVQYSGYANQVKQATQQTLLSGSSATYTTPAGALQLRIRMVGGGGGGGLQGVSNGGNGGQTSFGSTTALGGTGGIAAGAGGAGGAGGTTGTGTQIVRLQGGGGQNGFVNSNVSTITFSAMGGGSAFGTSGVSASANSGQGGRADGTVSGGSTSSGAGGAGEYVEFFIGAPAATYTYTVGTGGAAGGGTSQAGAAGIILIEERY